MKWKTKNRSFLLITIWDELKSLKVNYKTANSQYTRDEKYNDLKIIERNRFVRATEHFTLYETTLFNDPQFSSKDS